MAKKRLKIKDKQGNVIDYDISAASVTIDVEGKSLDVKLTELVNAIASAVTSVTFNGNSPAVDASGNVNLGQQMQADWNEQNTNWPSYVRNKPSLAQVATSGDYNDLSNKPTIPEGAQADTQMSDTSENVVQNKVIKAYVDTVSQRLNTLIGSGNVQGAIDTFNEVKAFLEGISSSDTLAAKLATLVPQTRTVNGKALSSNVTIGMSDIQGLVDAINNAGSGNVSVIQPDPADGTFIIRVGETDYTINLNHTHESMAKLVVCEESDLPSTLDPATIYGVNDGGEIGMMYVGGYPFYGGGGGSGTAPVLRSPADGATIDMGEPVSGVVSKTVKVKGKNLTQPLTVELSGSGFAFAATQPSGVTVVSTTQLTVTAAAANSLNGAVVTVEYSGTNPFASGTLGVTSGTPDNISCETTLQYNDLVALSYIKFDGNQCLLTDYHPNPRTHLEIDMQFEENANMEATGTAANNVLFDTHNNTVGKFTANFGSEYAVQYRELFLWMNQGYVSQVWLAQYPAKPGLFVRDVWRYKDNVVSFLGVNTTTETKTTTQDGVWVFGSNGDMTNIFDRHNIKVWSIKIYENDVLLHNYLPMKSMTDNVAGMFDTVTGTFTTSATSTEFIGID